uniref:Uncharacterized protein n=1 Tax=Aegilops tauschii subsp. strangulata TaxID=200361 RepID=A0A453QNG3_AEGTS
LRAHSPPLTAPAPRFSPSQISSLFPVLSSPRSASDDRNSVERPLPFSSYPPICTRSIHSLELDRAFQRRNGGLGERAGVGASGGEGGAVPCRLQRRLGVEVGQSSGLIRGPDEGCELELYPMKDLLRLGMKDTGSAAVFLVFFSIVAAASARSKSIDKVVIACPRSWS